MNQANTEEKVRLTGLDARIVIAIGICCLTSTVLNYFGLKFPFGEMKLEIVQKMTACIACLLCCQDNVKISRKAGITRLLVTAIGGAAAIVIVLLDDAINNVWISVVLVMLGILLTLLFCKIAKVPYISARIGGITFVLVVCTLTGPARIWYAIFRLLSTFYGVLVVLVVTWCFEKIKTKDCEENKK